MLLLLPLFLVETYFNGSCFSFASFSAVNIGYKVHLSPFYRVEALNMSSVCSFVLDLSTVPAAPAGDEYTRMCERRTYAPLRCIHSFLALAKCSVWENPFCRFFQLKFSTAEIILMSLLQTFETQKSLLLSHGGGSDGFLSYIYASLI